MSSQLINASLACSIARVGSLASASCGMDGPKRGRNRGESNWISNRADNGLVRRHGAMSSLSAELWHPICFTTVSRSVSGCCTKAHGLRTDPLSITTRWNRPATSVYNYLIDVLRGDRSCQKCLHDALKWDKLFVIYRLIYNINVFLLCYCVLCACYLFGDHTHCNA